MRKVISFGLALLVLFFPASTYALTAAQWQTLYGNTEYYTGSGSGQTGSTGSGGGSGCSGSDCTGTGSGTAPTCGSNQQQAFDYFVSQGLSAEASAGLVGNFMQESGTDLDPTANNGSHTGIAQWDDQIRWPNLLKVEAGKDQWALATQLDFVWYELTEGGYTQSVLDPLQQLDTSDPIAAVNNAATIVYNNYEIPGTNDTSLPSRQGYARQVYNQYANSSTCTPTTTGSTPPTTITPPDFIPLYETNPEVLGMGHGDLTNINALGIHYTEGNAQGMDLANFFLNGSSGDGIQFNIGTDGEVYEFFPLNAMQETWNIGDINDHEIGIEITGMDGEALLNDPTQFNAVVDTVSYLCDYYKIPCSNPKGNITNTTDPNAAQGLLGHDEAPNWDNPDAQHSDPDTKIVNGVQYDITTGNIWNYDTDSKNSSVHAYMIKLRTALGYNPTPS
jgi:hypothetical protein